MPSKHCLVPLCLSAIISVIFACTNPDGSSTQSAAPTASAVEAKPLESLPTGLYVLDAAGKSLALASPAPTSASVPSTPPGGKTFVFIRHCEKPSDLTDPNCSKQGYQRAQGLPEWMASTFGLPDGLFMMQKANPVKSVRGEETCDPISQVTGVQCIGAGVSHWKQVMKDGVAAGPGVYLYIWHHSEIPAMMQYLGCQNAIGNWPKGSFTAAPYVTVDAKGNPQETGMINEQILKGDPTTSVSAMPCTGPVSGSSSTSSSSDDDDDSDGSVSSS